MNLLFLILRFLSIIVSHFFLLFLNNTHGLMKIKMTYLINPAITVDSFFSCG
jgi:hypothetical protein